MTSCVVVVLIIRAYYSCFVGLFCFTRVCSSSGSTARRQGRPAPNTTTTTTTTTNNNNNNNNNDNNNNDNNNNIVFNKTRNSNSNNNNSNNGTLFSMPPELWPLWPPKAGSPILDYNIECIICDYICTLYSYIIHLRCT